ncbi:helix-turn-helix domain-containing protein [Streptomyces sp. JJ66]|uniref:helix-turn-helix domain-containing protein n=1 Tax=Streptomyces sp. JJ66 TaxID=2803843 RepID=UPI001C598C59|nr:helix-turn-helix transcriptional regulator [Streptomyces sp. JJ66]MBW1602795.1 helix-turn-helix domain-containing protein [Streptomyces sp. JJ66]
MPAREAPTIRQQRLGIELRKLRERAGLSATDAGAMLGIGQSRVSNIELGRIGVSPERVQAFARAYRCGDSKLVAELASMAGERGRHWWDEYRDLLPSALIDLAELEYHASALRSAQVSHLPGLLQTVDYARLTFQQDIPSLAPPEVEHRVSHRIKRQTVLYAGNPTPYTAVIHEAALRMQFGGREQAKAQLRHILEMSERPLVTVVVIPFVAGIFPGAGQSVVYAEGPVPQLDTVQLDSEHGSLFLHSDAQLDRYREFMKRFEAVALNAEASRDLILAISNTL